jgi:hypothetical protein
MVKLLPENLKVVWEYEHCKLAGLIAAPGLSGLASNQKIIKIRRTETRFFITRIN